MIFLFTDFGHRGPYVGQLHAVLARSVPDVPVIDLCHDLPALNARASSYLLPAYTQQTRPGDVVVAVVDPGVGSARRCVMVKVDGVWFLGPDNGLLSMVVRAAGHVQAWSLPIPGDAAATFHGRDVFAPAAALLAKGQVPPATSIDPVGINRPDWPTDSAEIVYIDPYGNAVTGLRVAAFPNLTSIRCSGRILGRHRTFSEVPIGEPFFYPNSNGLFEVAMNGASAADVLGLKLGSQLEPVST